MTTTTRLPEILTSVDDGVGQITLNAPARRNALTNAMAAEFVERLGELNHDPAVGAIVIRSTGSFCAGADRALLDEASRDPARDDLYRRIGGIYRAFWAVGHTEVPTVVAARGACLGAGLNLLLAADLRVVSEDLRIISGFTQLGLHPGGGHMHLLSRLGGREAAAAIAMFGEEIDGRRAVDLGLAWEAVRDDEVDGRAFGLARRAAKDPDLSRMLVRSLRAEAESARLDWSAAEDIERHRQMWSMRRRNVAG